MKVWDVTVSVKTQVNAPTLDEARKEAEEMVQHFELQDEGDVTIEVTECASNGSDGDKEQDGAGDGQSGEEKAAA